MKIEELELLTEKGEEEYNSDDEEELAITPPSSNDESQFNLEDINKKFKSFYLRDPLILLVGSCATQGKGVDIDLVMKDEDFPDILKEGSRFRLLRQMSGEFDIDYENTPNYLHIHDESTGSYTDYFPLYRLKVERIPNQEVHKMSVDDETNSDNFEILEKSKRRIIGGIATTSVIDRQNEEISPKAIKKIWEHLKKLPDNFLNLMIQHESSQIGILLKEYKNHKMALLDRGIYVIAEIRQDIPLADKVWKDIVSKKLHSLSIKINIPKPFKKSIEEICDDEKCWTRINDAKFLEISIVENAANPDCEKLDILSKENR